MWYPVFKILDWTDSSVSHILCAYHCVGPGITQVNMTFPVWSARGTCPCSAVPPLAAAPPCPLLFAAMEAVDNQIRSAYANAANSECFWVFHWASEVCLTPASWGGHLFKSRLTVSVFSGPAAALPSPQFRPGPFGWLHQVLFITCQLPQLVEETWREISSCFLLIFSPFCLAPSSCSQFSPPPSPFPSHRRKSFHFYDSQQNWIRVCLCSGKRRLLFPETRLGCAWASRKSAPHPPPWMCWSSWRTVSICVLEIQFPIQLDCIHKTRAQPRAGLFKTCPALLSLSEYLQIPTFSFWSFSSPKQKVSHSIMMPNFLHSKTHIHLFFFKE